MQLFHGKSALKILRSKMFFGSILPAFVLGILLLVYYSNIKDFPVFPNQSTFNYIFYSDNNAGGNSRILKQEVSDSVIQLDYIIGDQASVPFVRLSIGPKGSRSIDLGPYNQLIVGLKGQGINGIGISLQTLNQLKKSDKKSQEFLFYHIFKISPGANTYPISLDKFEVPDWWGESNRMEDVSVIRPDLKNLLNINVSSAFTPNTGKIQSIEISSMTFSRNNKPLTRWIITLELAFILLVFSVFYFVEKIKEKKQIITITYQAIENKSDKSSKSDFIDFINTNFHNSELTLELVSGETGVSQRRITNEIQNQFFCNFKTYINRLRINESKRLLLENKLNIGEIAFRVGFNNQSHFNRVFKAEMQISPGEFREKHKK